MKSLLAKAIYIVTMTTGVVLLMLLAVLSSPIWVPSLVLEKTWAWVKRNAGMEVAR